MNDIRFVYWIILCITFIACGGKRSVKNSSTSDNEKQVYVPQKEVKAMILFDATKAEMAGNADWVIDADIYNLGTLNNGRIGISKKGEANPQRYPTPSIDKITPSDPEDIWKGALSAWAISLVKAGYGVETLPYDGKITYKEENNPQDLSKYKVFVVCEPNIPFTTDEKKAILAFVREGGGLFMIADHHKSDRNNDGCDSPCVWNDLMETNPFGMQFDQKHYNEITENIATSDKNIINGVHGKVRKVKFSGGTSLTLFPSVNPTVRGVVYSKKGQLDSEKEVFCAYAQYGRGKVVALGDSSPADDGTGDPNDKLYKGWTEVEGHAPLILNATEWLLK
ncbi:MAG: hypothetical protein NZ455_08275 [Bacteroidia bacterium]|nr:hypothetical protein [Bacteroidia bacterium]MDW8348175.1 hypothetical protein [Bacteroidia bacterium]